LLFNREEASKRFRVPGKLDRDPESLRGFLPVEEQAPFYYGQLFAGLREG